MADLSINKSDTVTTLEAYNIPSTLYGGRLWSSGAEQQQIGANYELDASHNASISTTIFRSGLASYRCQVTTATTHIEKQFSAKRSGDFFYSRGYAYFTSFPSSISTSISGAHSDISIMQLTSSDGSFCEITIDASGVLRVYSDGNPRTLLGTSSAINLAQWYRLELAVSPYYRYVEAKLDGLSLGSASNVVGYEGFPGVNLALWGCGLLLSESSTVDMYWDDLAINEGAGVSQNSWPGAGQIVDLNPNAAGDNNTFTVNVGGTSGQANNYTRVNSVPQSDASYNGDVISGDTDDLKLALTPSSITSGDTINVVHVGIRYKVSALGTSAQLATRIKKNTAGTLSTQTITPGITSFQNYTSPVFSTAPYSYPITLYNDPDGNPWAKSTLDTAQVGYQLVSLSSTTELDVSGVWLVVDSTPGTAALNINVSDTTVTLESATPLKADTNLNISDTTTTSETVNVEQEYTLSVSDTTMTSELNQTDPPLSEILDDPADTTKVDERLTIYLPLANNKYLIINDNAPTQDPAGITPIPPSYVGPFGPLKFSVITTPYQFSIERDNPNDP